MKLICNNLWKTKKLDMHQTDAVNV